MTLHMLGGGPAQLAAVKRAGEMGLDVLVSDFDKAAPAFRLSRYQSVASTFDSAAVASDARKYGADFLMTTGTDQPVLTAAIVSEELELPYFLSVAQARIVTNKKVMKEAFVRHGIPTARFAILKEDFSNGELKELSFPLVIKPLDSQGQRGVMKVESPEEIRQNFASLLSFSREREILAEEYYPSDELTVNGWAVAGKPLVLMITDRVTVDNGPHIGVCISHRYPSLYHHREDELRDLVGKITSMIGLWEGPLYFQILAGEEGFKVNEIACRLGGAYEDEFIPPMTGFPLLDNMIEMTRGGETVLPSQTQVDKSLEGKFLSLQMFFASPGTLRRMEGIEELCSLPGVLNGRFLLAPGTKIFDRKNSTQRAGYFIVTGSSPGSVNRTIGEGYSRLRMEDEEGKSMIQLYERMMFPDEN